MTIIKMLSLIESSEYLQNIRIIPNSGAHAYGTRSRGNINIESTNTELTNQRITNSCEKCSECLMVTFSYNQTKR